MTFAKSVSLPAPPLIVSKEFRVWTFVLSEPSMKSSPEVPTMEFAPVVSGQVLFGLSQ